LTGANFKGAFMLWTNLRGAFMLWTNLDGANMTGAILPTDK